MNVSLTPQLEQYVQRKLDTGLYTSASEVIRDGLRLLQERDRHFEGRLERLQTEVRRGLADLDAGRAVPLDRAVVHRIKTKGRERLQATRRKKRA